jgi:hypothetical protein
MAKQRAEVIALRDQWERNEISSCEIWAYVNLGYITQKEALWIMNSAQE